MISLRFRRFLIFPLFVWPKFLQGTYIIFVIRWLWPRQKVSALVIQISYLGTVIAPWGPRKIQNLSQGSPCLCQPALQGPTVLCFTFYSELDSGQKILDRTQRGLRNLFLFPTWFKDRRQLIFFKENFEPSPKRWIQFSEKSCYITVVRPVEFCWPTQEMAICNPYVCSIPG